VSRKTKLNGFFHYILKSCSQISINFAYIFSNNSTVQKPSSSSDIGTLHALLGNVMRDKTAAKSRLKVTGKTYSLSLDILHMALLCHLFF